MTKIRGTSRLVGLIGWPVEHSLSPAMHNAAFTAQHLDWAYVPLPVLPEDLARALDGLKALNFVGVNVTIPHKQAVMRYLHQISDVAQSIGAVNTIVIKDGNLYGYNTDRVGFLESLREEEFEPAGKRCIILGAGGAARAVAFALANEGAESIFILNRTVERAEFLVEDLVSHYANVRFASQKLARETLLPLNDGVDLIVNTTSLGMQPQVNRSPWPDDLPIPPQATVCDLVYNPVNTRFLQQAAAAGARTIDGVGMLVHQGATAYRFWTGRAAPVEAMRRAVLDNLTHSISRD
ncbi:MAG: shikimate dehydrogenase [Anaerolineae bacterium]